MSVISFRRRKSAVTYRDLTGWEIDIEGDPHCHHDMIELGSKPLTVVPFQPPDGIEQVDAVSRFSRSCKNCFRRDHKDCAITD